MKTFSQNVLLIRSGALGDTLLTLPLLASIRSRHPHALVTFLGRRAYKELLPAGIAFEPMDRTDWLWLFGGGGETPPAGAPVFQRAYVVLNRPEDVVRNLRKARTTDIRVASSRPRAGKHVVEHMHEDLGMPVPRPAPALIHLADREKEDLLWVHPGSGGMEKCVPLPLLVALAKDLVERTGWKLAVTRGEEDGFLKTAPEWGSLLQGRGTLFLDCKPLTDLVARLSGARLFIGNDSGIGHLAAGLGIPSAVFFVTTDPAQWAPWVPRRQLLAVDYRKKDSRRTDWAGEIMRLIL